MLPRVPAQLLQPFSHLQLAADCTSDCPLHIDIVVGQDQYWSLVRSGLVRGPDGLAAMETPFGWVLSGAVEGGPIRYGMSTASDDRSNSQC